MNDELEKRSHANNQSRDSDAQTARPYFHFAPARGWMNDPHGICWVAGVYHLFYQQNAVSLVWAMPISWGHAVSTDLINWQEQEPALVPRPGEGCWSGSVLVRKAELTIFYTQISAGRTDLGQIAVAHPDPAILRWTAGDVIIDGPPDSLGAISFRDPCIVDSQLGLRMIVGVGVAGGIAQARAYRSLDGADWEYDGVLCSRADTETGGVATGDIWECPQLFPVGQDWVLVVSVLQGTTPRFVAAAVGRYDGTTFHPERWSRLTHDDLCYATTSFVDRTGRPCLMSWVREHLDHDPTTKPWSGMLTLAWTFCWRP